jgi:hypothetical protein
MRHGKRLGQLDFAFYGGLEILRLKLDVLQTPYPFVQGDLAREISKPNLGQSQPFC